VCWADYCFAFVIFICGNFRLTAATTEACCGFPELLAKASRAWAASGIGYFLVLFSTKSDFGSFFLAAVVSLAINDDSPVEALPEFLLGLPTDSVHPKLRRVGAAERWGQLRSLDSDLFQRRQ
jgi:hypothetical protein